MSEPKRIQRRRIRGWTMPENTVYVGRGSKWGNPYIVGHGIGDGNGGFRAMTREDAVALYRRRTPPWLNDTMTKELKGKDLACWCPPDQPCHADVLLEWANRP